MKEQYYEITDLKQIGRKADGVMQVYKDGEWVADRDHLLMDRLMGYDPAEPSDSPYGIGNTEIMKTVHRISLAAARERIAEWYGE